MVRALHTGIGGIKMNLLLINGSPKGKKSNSLRLAEAFIEGFRGELAAKDESINLEEVHVSSLRIEPCRGCFACWKKTPGKCCIPDDMESVIEKELRADIIIWSFPLYYFNVPGILKNLIDRRLPMVLPFMSDTNNGYGSGGHDLRYDTKNTKHILISTCGFYSAEGNYDSVCNMFDHFMGRGGYQTLFCGQGELFGIKELSARTDEYLDSVRRAGGEYASGNISEETKKELNRLLYPKDTFEKMADASWGVSKEDGGKETSDLIFTRQMAALYNKNAYDGKDRVLEMHYTDLEKRYRIFLGKDGSEVITDANLKSTTVINASFELWQSIARGEIDGAEALGKQLYTVDGDFSLMIHWDRFFGNADKTVSDNTKDKPAALKNPSMMTMLFPWIAFWIAVSIDAKAGAVITLAVTAFVPLIFRKHIFTFWDRLSIVAVVILCAAAFFLGDGNIPANAGYLVFGLMWLGSCMTKEPLCAAYVKYNYGGEKALDNLIFMKTNYILAACWGILYVLTSIWTFFARRAGFGNYLLIINNLVPVIMGFFTVWFEKWYPAHTARGKKKR